MESLLKDIRYGLRMIAKNPGFTLLAVLALALGICANTTIFSFINALLLRPLVGVKEPERLVAVYTSDYSSGLYGASSYPDYLDFRNQADAFVGLAAYEETVLNLTGGAEAERLRGVFATGNFFEVLGVTAQMGRTLQPSDDSAGSQPVVISNGLWQRRFNSDPAIVGQTLKLNGRGYTIVGLTPANFRGLRLGTPPDFWLAMNDESGLTSDKRGSRGLELVGRLKPDVSVAQAQAQLTTIAARLAQTYPESNMGTLDRPYEPRPMTVIREARIEPRAQVSVWRVSLLLFAVVGLVLLIACANVANLLLARASVRRREIATRMALGARRSRLVRQLLTESLLLAILGGTVGLIVTIWTAGSLPNFFPPTEASGLDLSLDLRVLMFTVGVVLATAVLFGLAPALKATRPDLVASLKDDAGSDSRRRRLSLRDALVISQLALSLVVLIGGALFVRSLRHALEFDPGFASQNLLLASMETRGASLNKEQGQVFYHDVLERVGGLPGVRAVSLTRVIPISGGGQRRGVELEGYQPQPNEDTELNTNVVGFDYFNTMGIPITQGRDFNVQDREGGPGVVIVNDELARRYFQGQSAVGRRLRFGSNRPYLEIVGIARSAKYRKLREQPLPFVYIPLAQEYQAGMTLVVRAEGDPVSLPPALRNEIRALNKDVPVFAIQTMTEHIGAQLAADRMIAVLLSIFGGAALLLAAIGIYGVIGYSVAQRRHEIGIRIALGAEQRDILKLIVMQGLMLVLIGTALGLGLALALTRVLKTLLFGVSATDPLTFSVIALLLIAVALLACYLPARRATKVDPLVALRYE
ncbi:MAG TPA: ABC transporter permease [Pyrinomonadaceae bacterium]|nr:ABC transporter permease [Pyrinomonadaceae bacterium]